MTWALVVMVCARLCTPNYVELYPTRKACMAHVVEAGIMQQQKQYCVPVSTDKEEK